MFGFFKRRAWTSEVIASIRGSAAMLKVVVAPFPCRVDRASGDRTYAYAEFGSEFIDELSKIQLKDFADLKRILDSGNTRAVFISLRHLPPMRIEVSGSAGNSEHQFYSDLADALIDAFQSERIKP